MHGHNGWVQMVWNSLFNGCMDTGDSGFMARGDLWGYNLIVLIFDKSSLGFMEIYG